MSGTRILAACSPGEVRIAVCRDDDLLDYAIWRPGAPDGVGDLHRGRILARVPAMAGAFVALEGAEGFLPDSEGAAGATEGTLLGVRVSRAAQGGKGPRLTARLTAEEQDAAAEGPVRLIRRGPGPLLELAARHGGAPVLADDPALVARLRPALGARAGTVARAFDDATEADIAALAGPEIVLANGVRLSIHPTPALVAIDMDAGATTAERRPKAAAQEAANRAALPALARQIRLRNLSGAIVVDLAGMAARRRAALGPALAAALAEDPLKPRLLGFTALGFAEILRPRLHPPLAELLAGPHAAGLAGLRELAARARARPAVSLRLCAAPAIVAVLEADAVAREDVQRLTGRPLSLRSDPALPAPAWLIEEVPHV